MRRILSCFPSHKVIVTCTLIESWNVNDSCLNQKLFLWCYERISRAWKISPLGGRLLIEDFVFFPFANDDEEFIEPFASFVCLPASHSLMHDDSTRIDKRSYFQLFCSVYVIVALPIALIVIVFEFERSAWTHFKTTFSLLSLWFMSLHVMSEESLRSKLKKEDT